MTGLAVNTGAVTQLGTRQERRHLGRRRIAYRCGVPTGDAQQHLRQLNLPFPFPDALQEFSVATGGPQPRTHALTASVNGDEVGHEHAARQRLEFFRDSKFNAAAR
jgi:hypothetical protein